MTTDGRNILTFLIVCAVAFAFWQYAQTTVEPGFEECGMFPSTGCVADKVMHKYGH